MKAERKILVVDDDRLTLNFFELTLPKLGYQVHCATDGLEALEKVQATEPDLILLDISMPKMDGFEFTQILKKKKKYSKYKDIPIIMLSGRDDIQSKILSLEMGIEDYIQKPFNFTEVLARIRNVMRQKALTAKVTRKERKLTLIEAFNAHLLTFVRHIKEPMKEMMVETKASVESGEYDVEALYNKYYDFFKEVEAMVLALEEEISELEEKKAKLLEEEISIEEIERKILMHIELLKNNSNFEEEN